MTALKTVISLSTIIDIQGQYESLKRNSKSLNALKRALGEKKRRRR